MTITISDKIKINKYINDKKGGKLYFDEICDAINKRGKITYVDLLVFCTNTVVSLLTKEAHLNYKLLVGYLSIAKGLIEVMGEAQELVPEEQLNKLRRLQIYYDEYLQKSGDELREDVQEDCIKPVLEIVNKYYPNTEVKESSAEQNYEVEKIQLELDKARKELEIKEKDIEKLKKTSGDKISGLKKEKKDLEKIKKQQEEIIKEHLELIESLKLKIEELESIVRNLNEEKNIIEQYQEEINNLKLKCDETLKAYEALKIQQQEEDLRKKELKALQKKQETLVEIVYQNLFYNGASIDRMIEQISKEGLEATREEVFEAIKTIRKNICVVNSGLSQTPSYRLNMPQMSENSTFSIDIASGRKYYDILLYSDFHIDKVNTKTKKSYERMVDHCVENNIGLILGLGDFYEGHGNNVLKYDAAIQNYKNIEKTIELLPSCPNLYHGMLGGNHEKSICRYGFDPLEILAQNRADFINLGYTHATIVFNREKEQLGKFDIHHPDTFDYPIHIDENGMFMSQMNECLTNLYKKFRRNREHSYIDIFGHTHTAQFNYPDAYYFIPAYGRDGATHLRIYFNDNNQIDCMVFMPLSNDYANNKFIKTNEIIYKKVLKK